MLSSKGSSWLVITSGLPASCGLCSTRTSTVPLMPMRPAPPVNSATAASPVALSTSPTSSRAGRSNSSRTSVFSSPSGAVRQKATRCIRVLSASASPAASVTSACRVVSNASI